VRLNLGIGLAKAGRSSDALAEYQAALRLQPDYADVHINLGAALAQAGRVAEGLDHLEAACRLKPDPELKQTIDRLRAGPH